MESLDTFTFIPVEVDPTTKIVTTPTASNTDSLTTELATLNALHKSMVGLETPNAVPAPPMPVAPKRSQNITNLRESGNQTLKKGDAAGAIRYYTLALDMALKRPGWEPQGLVREECAALYANRAQAYMTLREWADALVDADLSLEMKKPENSKAWWRKGRCLVEMGRLAEAKEAVGMGLDFKRDGELETLNREISKMLEKGS